MELPHHSKDSPRKPLGQRAVEAKFYEYLYCRGRKRLGYVCRQSDACDVNGLGASRGRGRERSVCLCVIGDWRDTGDWSTGIREGNGNGHFDLGRSILYAKISPIYWPITKCCEKCLPRTNLLPPPYSVLVVFYSLLVLLPNTQA